MDNLNRRGFLKSLGLVSAATIASETLWADAIYKGSSIVERDAVSRGPAAKLINGKAIRPEHEIKIIRDTDVLVVGGGCAGVVAALSAARAGAKVTIVERYGCFGGLWTGGMVLIVLATHSNEKTGLTKCVRGIGDEMLERLKKIPGGIINQAPGKRDPTSDPEATKYIMACMLREAGVDMLLHS
ncbi:MAG: FAD-dependent oxidoreductase, partial [Kiritimatiellia bacterium]|nr:FAD-dependent oxidoreductase [Kiritimatiellia bacterium]